jgi:hypothetical protein
VGFSFEMVFEGTSAVSQWRPVGLYFNGNPEAEQHAARIRFIMGDNRTLRDPIDIDCVCYNGAIMAIPEIIDGWHRLFAHWALKKCFIRARFSGRFDVLEYLTGETGVPPC